MRILKISILALIASTVITACGPAGEEAKTGDAQSTASLTTGDIYTIDSNSTVIWTGSKMAGDHTGTINITEGQFNIIDGAIIGGKVVLDMHSINDTDIDGEWGEKLEGHLMSEDFFHAEKFPIATFEISKVSPTEGNPKANMSITGNLTMKDVTKSVTFDALVNVANGVVKIAAPNFILDRTEWNVEYGSAKIFGIVKDKAIYDEMAINFNVTARN